MKPTDAAEIARLRLDREEAFAAHHEATEAWRKRGVEIDALKARVEEAERERVLLGAVIELRTQERDYERAARQSETNRANEATRRIGVAESRAARAEALLASVLVGALDYNDRIPRGFGNWRSWQDAALSLLDGSPLRDTVRGLIAVEDEHRSENARPWDWDAIHSARIPFVRALAAAGLLPEALKVSK